jgi:hypothetical protein
MNMVGESNEDKDAQPKGLHQWRTPMRNELIPCDTFQCDPTHQNLNQIASLEALYLLKSHHYLMSDDF